MTVLIDQLRPKSQSWAIVFDCMTVLTASLFLGVMSQLALPLWFTPVPLSMLTFGVMLVGATLGSKKGSLAVLAFLAEGALGLPMFAGLRCGIAVLFGPTGGYLFGSVIAAFVIGYFLERGWVKKYGFTALALLIGSVIILACGSAWLGCMIGMKQALALGVYPFLIGDLIKVAAAATLVPTCWKLSAST